MNTKLFSLALDYSIDSAVQIILYAHQSRSHFAVSMLVQRCRRWPSIKPAEDEGIMFIGWVYNDGMGWGDGLWEKYNHFPRKKRCYWPQKI